MTDTSAPARPRRLAAAARWSVFGVLLLAFLCVPFVLLDERMHELVQRMLQSDTSRVLVAAAAIGLLVADIALPIPSSLVLTSAGLLLGFWAGAAVGFVGLTCAAWAGWGLGRCGGAPLARRIVGDAQLARFAALAERHGDTLLVACRAMPVLAEATTLLAGMSRMPLPRFTLVVSLGNAVVAALYAWLGAIAADAGAFAFAFVAAMVVPAVLMLLARRLGCADRPS